MIVALVNVLLIAGASFTSARGSRARPVILRVTIHTATVLALLALAIALARELGMFEPTLLVVVTTTISITLTLVALAWFAVWDFLNRTTDRRLDAP